MDLKLKINKLSDTFKKYRYALIVLLIGLILMVVPSVNRNEDTVSKKYIETTKSSVEILEDKLSALLSKVQGAGDVEVILTIAAGEEVIYQTNDDNSESDTSTSQNINTVTITDAERNQTGLIKQVRSEVYQGAIVVCRGADDPTVRLAIVDAVCRITGLGSNCISILKMK